MTLLPVAADKLRPVLKLAAFSLAIAILARGALAQDAAPESPAPPQKTHEAQPPDQNREPETEQTFTISNATAPSDMNDIQTALRNMLPRARIFGIQTQHALAIRATAADMESARRMITELDRPRKAWRVTYTIAQVENGKRVATRSVALIVVDGTRTTLRQGNRIPLLTGMQKGAAADQNPEVQYIDVGLSIDADLDGSRLRTKIEQAALADEKSGLGAEDPVVHQTRLEAVSNLASGKPVVLGSLDVPGAAGHEEIEVTCEPLD